MLKNAKLTLLARAVTITRPDFPSDSPHGIALKTETAIPSLSNLGVQLGTATFIAKFEGIEGALLRFRRFPLYLLTQPCPAVGPISANDLTLAPLATTDAVLTGEALRQSSSKGLDTLGVLFSQFLQGVNQVRGCFLLLAENVLTYYPSRRLSTSRARTSSRRRSPTRRSTGSRRPSRSSRSTSRFRADTTTSSTLYVLPAESLSRRRLANVRALLQVTLQDLTIQITEQSEAYAVPTSNNRTVAIYQNPFGFSLTAIAAGGDFYMCVDSPAR
jgi:hypothetical protein